VHELPTKLQHSLPIEDATQLKGCEDPNALPISCFGPKHISMGNLVKPLASKHELGYRV
jgi:hypothetical protein